MSWFGQEGKRQKQQQEALNVFLRREEKNFDLNRNIFKILLNIQRDPGIKMHMKAFAYLLLYTGNSTTHHWLLQQRQSLFYSLHVFSK